MPSSLRDGPRWLTPLASIMCLTSPQSSLSQQFLSFLYMASQTVGSKSLVVCVVAAGGTLLVTMEHH